MSRLENLVGDENIVAECSGVNYTVYVTESRLLVGKRFAVGAKYVNVSQFNVGAIELITKSILPPLTLAVLAAIGGFLVWWFPGGARTPLPASPYDLGVMVASLLCLAGLGGLLWRKRVGALRIGIVGSREPITVRLVRTSKADSVFRALRG